MRIECPMEKVWKRLENANDALAENWSLSSFVGGGGVNTSFPNLVIFVISQWKSKWDWRSGYSRIPGGVMKKFGFLVRNSASQDSMVSTTQKHDSGFGCMDSLWCGELNGEIGFQIGHVFREIWLVVVLWSCMIDPWLDTTKDILTSKRS